MQLFEFTKTLFEDPRGWSKVSKTEKKKHFFMTTRFMSIAFPLQAQALNNVKVDQPSAMDFWQEFMRTKYNRVPGWMYTKGAKKKKEEQEAKVSVSEKSVLDYARDMSLDPKSVKDALKFFGKETTKEIKKWEKVKNP